MSLISTFCSVNCLVFLIHLAFSVRASSISQLAERIAVEEANARELQRFNAAWDRAMIEYDTKTQALVEQMQQRHAHEFREYQDELRARYPLRPKFSRDLLNTRRIQQVLAKQNQYAEAHRVKAKADLVEEWEMSQQTKQWFDKLEKLERLFVSKQDTEIAALVKRIQSGRVGQMRARQSEYERLLQRYQNIKKELLNQQNVERLKAEKQSAHASAKPLSLQYVPPIEVVPQSPVAARSTRVAALLEASAFHSHHNPALAASSASSASSAYGAGGSVYSPIASANAAAAAALDSLTRSQSQPQPQQMGAPLHSAREAHTQSAAPASQQLRRPQSAAPPSSSGNEYASSGNAGRSSSAFDFSGASAASASASSYASPFAASGTAFYGAVPPVPFLPGASPSSSAAARSNGGVGLQAAVGASRSGMTKQFVPMSRVSAPGSPSATDRVSRTPKASNAR